MYATVEQMIDQWGEAEMIRLTAPEGQLDELVVRARAERALADASATIDSYLRRRYAVPLADPIPAEVAKHCRAMARFELAHGEQREPTTQMIEAQKAAMAWLRDVSDGKAEIAAAAAPENARVAGRVQDREAMLSAGAGLIG